jgi:hypothetical protein
MNTYLVTGTYYTTHYMADASVKHTFQHLVLAGSEVEAEEKIGAHYESKTEEYSVYYRLGCVNVNETIS